MKLTTSDPIFIRERERESERASERVYTNMHTSYKHTHTEQDHRVYHDIAYFYLQVLLYDMKYTATYRHTIGQLSALSSHWRCCY
jgi:hypothetical protein